VKNVVLNILICAPLAFAADADFNDDGRVDWADFALLAADWRQSTPSIATPAVDLNGDGTVDLADLVVFAESWLDHVAAVPTAHAVSVSGTTHTWLPVVFNATDDGRPRTPGKLNYILQSYPDAPAQLLDPARGAGLFAARHIPKTVSSWGNAVLLWTPEANTYTFTYLAHDGGTAPTGGASDPATVTVAATAYTPNHLAFDGRGRVTFDHHAAYNVASGWAVHLYLRTTRPHGGVIGKRDGDGPGWQLDLVSGRPVFRLFDGSDPAGITLAWKGEGEWAASTPRIDDGGWHTVAAGVYTVDEVVYAMLEVDSIWFDDGVVLPSAAAFATTADVVLGRTGRGGYRGDIDKLRFFAAYNPTTVGGMIIELGDEPLRQSTLETALVFGTVSAVRFMCDEGSGTTVTDDKQALTGTLATGAQWLPIYDPFVPSLN